MENPNYVKPKGTDFEPYDDAYYTDLDEEEKIERRMELEKLMEQGFLDREYIHTWKARGKSYRIVLLSLLHRYTKKKVEMTERLYYNYDMEVIAIQKPEDLNGPLYFSKYGVSYMKKYIDDSDLDITLNDEFLKAHKAEIHKNRIKRLKHIKARLKHDKPTRESFKKLLVEMKHKLLSKPVIE